MAGRYRAHPEYKDSKVEMLGFIPSHWNTRKVRFLLKDGADGIKIGPFGSALKLEDMVESGKRVYGQENVIAKDFSLGKRAISDAKFQEMQVYQVVPNDLLITMMGTSGKCVLVPHGIDTGIIDSHLLRLRANESEILPKYFRLLIDECYEIENQIKISGKGSIMHGLNSSIVKALQLPMPSCREQERILAFLDHETTKIDTLIEKQQQLIKLLKEKRQAVISHAVTKGLNPNAKMRDSGVEWLGEVPEHWVVAQLKFNTLEMQTGPFGSQLHAEDYVDDGIPLINPAHMTDGKVVPDSKVSVDRETWNRLSRHQLFEGDLIFARRGELGRCAVVTKGEEGWLCGTGSLKAKLNEKLVPEYSYLLITSDGVVSELSLESKGSTMDNLNTETLGRVRLPVPPIVEQKNILNYVKEVSGKYGLLIDKASFAIELMKERRTALISAAVTGKIDVRDWQPPNG